MASYSPVPNPEREHTDSPSPFADRRRDSSPGASSSRSPPAHAQHHPRPSGIRPLSLLKRDSSATLYSVHSELTGDGSASFSEKMVNRTPPLYGSGPQSHSQHSLPPYGHPHSGSRESTLSLTIPPGQMYPHNFGATVTLETGWKKYKRMRSLAPGWGRSVLNVVISSWVNVLILTLPLSWIAHFRAWSMTSALFFSLLGLIPLAHCFEFPGEQMALYCGQTLGDLIVITLSKQVLPSPSLIRLNCELRLAQATISGVVLLHLLLVPGCAFLTGGAKIWYQQLGEHASQLNQSLLAAGFIFMLIPTVFFIAIGSDAHLPDGAPVVQGAKSVINEMINSTAATTTSAHARGLGKRGWMTTDLTGYNAVSDETRGVLLQISRGMAVIMLIIYIASRVYLHNPPGDKPSRQAALAALSPREREDLLENSKPVVNPGVCAMFLTNIAAVMTLTIEWNTSSETETLLGAFDGDPFFILVSLRRRWLGLILLPLTSFAADAMIVTVYFIKTLFRRNPPVPEGIAHGRSIDLSVQFLLFWMPFIVLVSWVMGKPFSLLFDIFELACIFGGCFLVKYITQDAETNWAEGLVMIMPYVVIAMVAWYYPSQRSHSEMMACTTTVLRALMGEEVNHGV
ncbi:hypothetical protein FRB90_006669 [Tulasnella sp. 427]|nr:hypothetical protein FRB90_006669 [Tulasnella sp. 427]